MRVTNQSGSDVVFAVKGIGYSGLQVTITHQLPYAKLNRCSPQKYAMKLGHT